MRANGGIIKRHSALSLFPFAIIIARTSVLKDLVSNGSCFIAEFVALLAWVFLFASTVSHLRECNYDDPTMIEPAASDSNKSPTFYSRNVYPRYSTAARKAQACFDRAQSPSPVWSSFRRAPNDPQALQTYPGYSAYVYQ